ncbi:F-box protein At3g58530 [Daucus carota subsp. sativus]|nr:PREDICTED: F-box protein At3g58530 [Daucus carota subsp. sativus]
MASEMIESNTVIEEEEEWRRDTILPEVMKIVCSRSMLPHKDLISLLLVSPSLRRSLNSYSSLWPVIDLREYSNAGDRLLAALSLARYQNVNQISLEFAQGVEDKHMELLKKKFNSSVQNLEHLNLNGCQKITDKGVEAITDACPKLKSFSIYWNVRVSDLSMTYLVKNCKNIVDLNLSGCKNISDKSLELIASNYQLLESLNLTRCVKLTDGGLQQILCKCCALRTLNLYADSSFTDVAYKKFSLLVGLRFLDLCGAQNLSDEGLSCVAKCKNLVSLNLTWCVRLTDAGVISVAQGCTSLEFLSLFGIVGVTDKCLEALSTSCSNTITTLDVNGCVGIKRRSREELLQLFPRLICFKVHS